MPEPDPDPDPDPDPVAVCPAGQMPSRAGGCLQPMQCAPGEVWDEASQECVPEKGEGVLLGRCGTPCFRNASYLVPLGSLRVWGSMALWSVFLIRGWGFRK